MATGNDPRPSLSHQARAAHDFREIVLTDRQEAINVIESLINRVETYGQTSVKDFYDLVGVTGTHADQNWGWTDLRDANVSHHRGGWLLDLPKPAPLRR